MKHLTEEELILHHYGEETQRKDSVKHLEDCAQCRTELQSLRNVLATVSATPAPEREDSFGAEMWRQIGPALANDRRRRPRFALARWPQWALAMAMLAVAGFLFGRLSSAPKKSEVASAEKNTLAAPTNGPALILLNELSDHLERSQIALIDLLNSKSDGPVDLSSEKILARELVAMIRLFRRASSENGETATATVLDELERALVEVANAPTRLSAEEFAVLRRRVGGESLIFKVRIVAQQLRAREKSLFQENTRRS